MNVVLEQKVIKVGRAVAKAADQCKAWVYSPSAGALDAESPKSKHYNKIEQVIFVTK